MASVDDEWWTAADIADYLGITVKSVHNYSTNRRPKGNPMPKPDRRYGRTTVWRPVRIVEWHATRPGSGNWRRRK